MGMGIRGGHRLVRWGGSCHRAATGSVLSSGFMWFPGIVWFVSLVVEKYFL